MANLGIAIGKNRGHRVTKRKAVKPSKENKGPARRVKFVRDIIKEVAGQAPYEKRVMELLKVGKEKRALKLCKRKLGTHLRAKRKREDLSNLLRKSKK
ncbi:hypothetical protein QBZ16_000298 [Prototheca wickerhamii]|uniref:60S ribosomal protein L36 n=1 Tax=Prototheca wickerhamii TaxID=3111 RepID=A0AAD9MLZ4_PROWI|nr:hypothetical protein QBZ16_000298 [Prototheca wickerhamii]